MRTRAGGAGPSASALDALQRELEEGVAAVLASHARLLGLLAGDTQSANTAQARAAQGARHCAGLLCERAQSKRAEFQLHLLRGVVERTPQCSSEAGATHRLRPPRRLLWH